MICRRRVLIAFNFWSSCSGWKVWLAAWILLISEEWTGQTKQETRRKCRRIFEMMTGKLKHQLKSMLEKFLFLVWISGLFALALSSSSSSINKTKLRIPRFCPGKYSPNQFHLQGRSTFLRKWITLSPFAMPWKHRTRSFYSISCPPSISLLSIVL